MSAAPGQKAPALPTGTVTFIFTDIEGSTARWDRNRSAMQAAVRRHDELMRSAIAQHGGHVFKTIGDAFCAAFNRPEEAVAAALEAQRALAAEDFSAVDGLRVRMAIHTGTADERDGDYFGPVLNRVARLLAIGHGGQTLVSGVTTDLTQGVLPSQASLRDLGEHRLRDLARPEQVYQLLGPDLAVDFPPLRSIDLFPNNLPPQLKSFVGRESEIAEITALVSAHRLVTLVGSGGVGKTRTSLQVAANLLDGSGDGVWFIELAPLSSGDYIAPTIAQALGVTLPPKGDPLENLARELKNKNLLLVFDNCEHMVEPAARVISAILQGCPKVKVLASSRQGLGIGGEATYRMPSLTVPGSGDAALTADESTQYSAIALFAERARAADNRFTLSDENAPIIADICRRLDGIPLALELAASRVKILSPSQLRERLDQRFRVLTGGGRDVLPRQQTMRALIDWSHDLLDERERVLFRRLGTFVNGFTLEGAVAVGRDEGFDEFDVFDVLASLVDKSLVLAEPDGDSLRYRLLESTRAYASEKLEAAGEEPFIAGRHLRYFRDRFAELRSDFEQTGRPAGIIAALRTELEDVRAALDGALVRSEIVDGAQMLADVGAQWRNVGFDREGGARCERYLALLPAGHWRVRAQLIIGIMGLVPMSSARFWELTTEAVDGARASGDDSLLVFALLGLAQAATELERFDDAEKALAEAEALLEITPSNRSAILRARAARASYSTSRGDFETAVRLWEEVRREFYSLGNTLEGQRVTLQLALVEHERGQTARAIEVVRETLPSVRAGASWHVLYQYLVNFAALHLAVDDGPGAVAALREALGILSRREPGHSNAPFAIENLALALALRGDLARAATLEGYADAAITRTAIPRDTTDRTTFDRLTTLLREGLAQGERTSLLAEGAALAPEAAIALALEAGSDP